MWVVWVNGERDASYAYELSALDFAWVMRARGYHVEVEEE